MNPGSNWYEDPALLTAEVKRARASSRPALEIRGYVSPVEIARGGQGIVYRAIQRSTHRDVAIKVLLDGSLASGAAQRRFEREIDLVASLRHPGIVSVYDSGTTDDGRMYLVMEYVEGVPLEQVWPEWSSGRAPIHEVLETIARTAEAVQYAHQRGVIHRDIKPSNIRVDSSRQPHILDFGLAKASGLNAAVTVDGSRGQTLSTTGQFMGSLPWASPEQASGNPDAVDARTDVYALGVILHQLLTGKFPYDISGGLKPALDNIVNATATRADRLRPEVGDEVGTIIAKALSKEPDRRYQSAGELARDIRHYLAGEPIEAKRDSTWYTVKKTLRRYRLATGAALAFVVLLCAALIVSIALQREARRQEKEARSQADKVGAVNEFVLGMLGAVDPNKDGPNTPIADLLDKAAETVDTRYAQHADLRESLHDTLRLMYSKLSLFPKARAEGEKLVALRKEIRGPEHYLTLSAEADLAGTMAKEGHAKEAIVIAERVLEAQRRILGPLDQRTLSTVTTLGQALLYLDRAADAAKLYSETLDAARTKYSAEDDTVMVIAGNLAQAYHSLGKLSEAERYYQEALDLRLKVNGPDHTETLTVQNNLATLYILQNRLTDAEKLLRLHLESLSRRLGPLNADVLGAKSNFSKLLQDLNKLDEAEKMMVESLEGRIKILGEDHPHTLVTMNNLASLYARQKKFEDSERVHRRTLALRMAKLTERHTDTVISMNNLAGTLRDQGKYDEALGLYEKAVQITDSTLPTGHHYNALFRGNLGLTLLRMKRYAEAEPALLRAHDDLVKVLTVSNPQTRNVTKNLVDLYKAWDKPGEAAKFTAELEAPPPPPPPPPQPPAPAK